MIPVVLDTNVVVSGMPASVGAPAELIKRWLQHDFELILSDHILDGVARAWNQPYWRARYHADHVERAIALLRARATMVDPVVTIHGVGEDEEDDLVISTAVAGNARYLVTGDRRLQEVTTFAGIVITSPRAFVIHLDEEVEASP